MGQPGAGRPASAQRKFIALCGEPREVKHLSTSRKGNQDRDSLSSGERTGKSPNCGYMYRQGCGAADMGSRVVVERHGKAEHSG